MQFTSGIEFDIWKTLFHPMWLNIDRVLKGIGKRQHWLSSMRLDYVRCYQLFLITLRNVVRLRLICSYESWSFSFVAMAFEVEVSTTQVRNSTTEWLRIRYRYPKFSKSRVFIIQHNLDNESDVGTCIEAWNRFLMLDKQAIFSEWSWISLPTSLVFVYSWTSKGIGWSSFHKIIGCLEYTYVNVHLQLVSVNGGIRQFFTNRISIICRLLFLITKLPNNF